MKQGSVDKKRLVNSFKYAFNGIKLGILNEQNLVIHFITMILVIIVGLLLRISFTEWMICIILFVLVISAELINTAIESVCDAIDNKYNKNIKIAKDTAAAAVLIRALGAIIIGIMIFLPKLLEVIKWEKNYLN